MTIIPIQVTVDMPEEAVPPAEPGRRALAIELRLLWLLDQVRRGNLSVGKGAELARLDRLEFLEVMKDHGMPAIAYPADDLAAEIDLLAAM